MPPTCHIHAPGRRRLTDLATLQGLGLTLPSPTEILLSIVFGLVGWVAWRRGRKTERPITQWAGVALMVYPYLVSGAGWLLGVGLALCAVLWFDRV